MSHREVPDYITDDVLKAVNQDYPEVTAIMVVSEHADGSATVSIAGRKASEQAILETIAKGVATWELQP